MRIAALNPVLYSNYKLDWQSDFDQTMRNLFVFDFLIFSAFRLLFHAVDQRVTGLLSVL